MVFNEHDLPRPAFQDVPADATAAPTFVDPSAKPTAPDPFDLERLVLTQDFAANLGVAKVVHTVRITKPEKTWWVRTHPDTKYRAQTVVLELKEEREIYLVDRTLWGELEDESTVGPRLLVTAVNRNATPFIWPIRLPGTDGKLDPWNRSAMQAADMAREKWIRVTANMKIGTNDIFTTKAQLVDPVFPEIAFPELLRIAFGDRVIDSMDHPVLRRLRGEL